MPHNNDNSQFICLLSAIKVVNMVAHNIPKDTAIAQVMVCYPALPIAEELAKLEKALMPLNDGIKGAILTFVFSREYATLDVSAFYQMIQMYKDNPSLGNTSPENMYKKAYYSPYSPEATGQGMPAWPADDLNPSSMPAGKLQSTYYSHGLPVVNLSLFTG